MKDKKSKEPLTHSNIPATVGLVHEVRKELKAEIRGVGRKVDSLESKIDSVEKRLEAKMDKVMSIAHGTMVIVEEQRAENRIVLDGLKTMIDRQDRTDVDLNSLRDTVHGLKTHGA